MIKVILKQFLQYCAVLFMVFLFCNVQGQNNIEDVGDLKKTANMLFKQKKFVEAYPLYSQLLSLDPKNPELGYRFGVCNLYADKREPEKALKYLQNASKVEGMDYEVFYYLGQAQHFSYRFPDAVRSYEKFKTKAGSKAVKELDVDRKIEMCKSGMRLLSQISDIYVLEKVEVNRSDFYRSYYKSDIGGVFLVKPENFMSKADKDMDEGSLVFFPDNLNVVCFASYGKEGEFKKDIYFSYRGADRTWTEPERLDANINSAYDEDYPYLMPDGKTLFFSSKGHNSMGGYDIFRSVYDSANRSWSKAENLDFAINTPYDDILFVPDFSGNYAYFSSDRATIEGKINVYKVRVDLRPTQKLDIDFQQFVAGRTDNDPRYEQFISLIKDLSVMEVNATTSMFDELTAAATTPVSTNQEFAKMASGMDSISKSMNQKVTEKISDKAALDEIVDSAFALLQKSEKSMDNLKLVKQEKQKLFSGLPKESSTSLKSAISDDIDKALVRKEIKLTQLKKLAGETQQLATVGTKDELINRLRQMTDLVEPEDTALDFRNLIRSEITSVINNKPSEQQTKFLSENTIAAISAPSASSKKQEPEEYAKAQQVLPVEKEPEEEEVVVYTPDPNALKVGDSIPPDQSDITQVAPAGGTTLDKAEEESARFNQKQLLNQLNSVKSKFNALNTAVILSTAAKHDEFLRLDKAFNKLESQGLTETNLQQQRRKLHDSILEIGKDYLVSYAISDYLGSFFSSLMDVIDSMKTDISKVPDLRMFIDSVTPGNEFQEYQKLITLLETRLSLTNNEKSLMDFIAAKKAGLVNFEKALSEKVSQAVAEDNDLSIAYSTLVSDIDKIKDTKVKREFQMKAGEIARERKSRYPGLLEAYNTYSAGHNLTKFFTDEAEIQRILSKRLHEIGYGSTPISSKNRTLSDTVVFSELDNYMKYNFGLADETAPIAFTEKELSEPQNEKNPKVVRMNEVVKPVQNIAGSPSPIIAAVESFRKKYSKIIGEEPIQQAVAVEPGKASGPVRLSDEYINDSKKIAKMDGDLEKIRQQTTSSIQYIELSADQSRQLKLIEDSLDALMTRYETNQARYQAEQSTDKNVAYSLELALFEITALSQKVRYYNDFRNIQLKLKDLQLSQDRIPTTLIQDANYFAEKAKKVINDARRESLLEVKKKGLEYGVALQDSVLKRLSLALSKIEPSSEVVVAADNTKYNAVKETETAETENQLTTEEPTYVPSTKRQTPEVPGAEITELIANLTPVQEKTYKVLNKAVKSMDFPDIKELYYTVQVGVFRASRTSERLLNLNPLFEDHLPNGLYRYCSGVYISFNDAVKRRDQIRDIGIPDAFIIAYYKGKRISADEASRIRNEKLSSVFTQSEVNTIVKDAGPKLKVSYKVQLVAYRRDFTTADMNRFRNLIKQDVEAQTNDAGLHVLTTVPVASFESVRQLKKEIVNKGIADAFITAYINGKRVSINDARGAETP